jgi:hypothetical protein
MPAKSGGRSGSGRKPATQTIKPKKAGQKAITFKPGGLHESLGVPQGQPIPAAKLQSALAGNYGPKAAEQARFAKNVLTGPKSGGSSTTTRRKGTSRGKRT